MDASLIPEVVAAINVPLVESLGVRSHLPIGSVDQSSTMLGGGGASVAQPSFGSVGPAFSYPFVIGGVPFLFSVAFVSTEAVLLGV
jgi:hypothetical protein